MERKRNDRPAIVVQMEDILFSSPITKKKLTATIRDMKKKNSYDTGENNYSTQFKGAKTKTVLIYLDIFRKEIKDDIIKKLITI